VSTDTTQSTIQSDQVDENDEIITDLSPLFDKSPTDFPTPLEADDRSELIRLQQSDPDLSALFDLVNKAEHPYTICAGVLLRAWSDKLFTQEATFHQIVVPTVLCAELLFVAHEIPAAGHLGVAETKDVCYVIFIGRASPRIRNSFVAAVTFANAWVRVRGTLQRHSIPSHRFISGNEAHTDETKTRESVQSTENT